MTPSTRRHPSDSVGDPITEDHPAGGTAPMVSLSNVAFSYGDASHTLFEDLSLEFPSGAKTAILGPNGSGKTTLLHLILGILAPTDGVVCLARRPREHYSRHDLGQLIELVSQDEFIPL
jgi:ABC-type bacteriocin/lantibiotic exporter with double-glycine peptidase domain